MSFPTHWTTKRKKWSGRVRLFTSSSEFPDATPKSFTLVSILDYRTSIVEGHTSQWLGHLLISHWDQIWDCRVTEKVEFSAFPAACALSMPCMHACVSPRYACYMYINVTWLLRVSFNGTSKGQLFLLPSVVVWCFFQINWASCLRVEWNALEPHLEPNRWWRTAQRTVLFAQKRPLKIHLNAAGVRVISTFCI